MLALPLDEIALGIYLGFLAGIFPGFIAFVLGFAFKYFTNVTIPGLGVVALAGGVAGVSGGLMGLLDPAIADSWVGIVAVIVILMISLWAHAIGDNLGASTPRHLTLSRLRESRLSADLVDRVDSYGQLRVRPLGSISDIEGFPHLTVELQETIKARSWKFPGGLPLGELERRVRDQLLQEFDLAEVEVSIDRRGRARIAAAPAAAGLSRRIPEGRRAVTIETLLPTGIARGDEVELALPDGSVCGSVLSARTTNAGLEPTDDDADEPAADESTPPPQAPTTTGGEGRITVAVTPAEARQILARRFAPILVNSQGKQREYEAVTVLRKDGNQFRTLTIGETSEFVGQTIGESRVRERFGVVVLALTRGSEPFVAPSGKRTFEPEDEVIIAGKCAGVRAFGEAAT